MIKQPAVCHPDRPLHAFGMCLMCYKRQWRKKKEMQSRIDQREYRKRNPEKVKEWWLRSRRAHNSARLLRAYGINIEQYEELLEFQHGKCAICGGGNGKKRLTIDHCHTTGMIRGLLCSKCNSAIGLMNDNPDIVLRASDYLRRAPIHVHKS